MDKAPQETEYYDVLEIPVDADNATIRKAYYKMARLHHPDKGGDENKFKVISAAYEVLSNPEKREQYNKYGKSAFSQGEFTNPRELFQTMFGGEKFAEFFGEISLFDMMSGQSNMEAQMNPRAHYQKEVEMITKLSDRLLEKLSVYTDHPDRVNEFRETVRQQAEDLKTEGENGASLLTLVGYVYFQEARQHLGGLFGAMAEIKEKFHTLSSHIGAMKSAMKLGVAQEKLVEKQQQEQREGSPTEGDGLEEEVYQQGFVALFKVGKLEIEATMRRVCEHVLGDPTYPKNVRQKRAEALKIMGEIFTRIGAVEERRIKAEKEKEIREGTAGKGKKSSGEGSSSGGSSSGTTGQGEEGGESVKKEGDGDEEDTKKSAEDKSDPGDDDGAKKQAGTGGGAGLSEID